MRRAILFVLGALADRLGGLGLFAAVLSLAALLWYVVKAASRFLASIFVPLLLVATMAGCHRGVNHEAFLLIGGVLCALWVLVGVVRIAFRLVFIVGVVLFIAALFAGCDGGAMRVPAEPQDLAILDASSDCRVSVAIDAGVAVDVEVDTRTAIPTCGAGAIVVLKTCNLPESGEWLCQEAEARDDLPCAVPNLSRFIVAECGQCEGVLR